VKSHALYIIISVHGSRSLLSSLVDLRNATMCMSAVFSFCILFTVSSNTGLFIVFCVSVRIIITETGNGSPCRDVEIDDEVMGEMLKKLLGRDDDE